MGDISKILIVLKDFTESKLIIVLLFGVIFYLVYINYSIKKDTKEINKAVNNKQPHELTLREGLFDERERSLERHEEVLTNFNKINKSVTGIHEKLHFHDEKFHEHDKRITLLEN